MADLSLVLVEVSPDWAKLSLVLALLSAVANRLVFDHWEKAITGREGIEPSALPHPGFAHSH